MARPSIEITEELCEKAKTLSAQGLTMEQIALTLGMGERTLYEKKAEFPQFSQAIEAGRAAGIASVTNALFRKATSGDVGAIKYYLNNRSDEWSEKQEVDLKATHVHEDRLAHLR